MFLKILGRLAYFVRLSSPTAVVNTTFRPYLARTICLALWMIIPHHLWVTWIHVVIQLHLEGQSRLSEDREAAVDASNMCVDLKKKCNVWISQLSPTTTALLLPKSEGKREAAASLGCSGDALTRSRKTHDWGLLYWGLIGWLVFLEFAEKLYLICLSVLTRVHTKLISLSS